MIRFTISPLTLTLPLLAMLVFSLVSAPVVYAQIDADDFLAVVAGGTEEIQQPADVVIEEDVVTAATAQDAINVAVEENEKELADGDSPEVGCKMTKFGSGIGFVATGAGSYRSMPNPTASRIAKRKAYVIAFEMAKKNLAEHLNGLSDDSKTQVRQALTNINLTEDEMTNISTETSESISQAVDMMLRGFVIYKVNDNPETSIVHVSIVTTPKTRGELARLAPNTIEAASLRDGLNHVISEVKAGIVPPLGGKIVLVPSTGETAFVGFGSSVTRSSSSAAAQAKLNLVGGKVAKARASTSLCGVIIGDRTTWEGKIEDTLLDATAEFDEFKATSDEDPLADAGPMETKKLDKAYETFTSTLRTNDVYNSARRGVLPPGVNTKIWTDEDNTWTYAMAVYIPSLTNAAATAGRQMSEANIIQGINDGSGHGAIGKPGQASGGSNATRPGKKIKVGPSGTVSDDDDL
jgi:hypothetical protein